MAAKKPSRNGTRTIPVRPVEPEYVDDREETVGYPDAADETVRAILRQFGEDDVEIKVYKQLPGGGEQYWYSAKPDQIGEEQIRTVNGGHGGNFALKIYVDGELRRAKILSIADAPGLTAAAPAPGTAGGSSDPAMVLLLQRLASLETQLQQRQTPREPINDLADAMVKLDTLRGGGAQKELPIDTILKCIEIGKSIGGGGAPADDGFLGVLKDVLKEVAPVAIPLLMGGGARSAGAPGPQLPAGETGVTEMDRLQAMQAALKEGIVYLKKKCMIGADPDLYLALICDNADNDQYAQLIHLATTQEFEVFARLDSEISQPAYAPFFKHIYDGIRSTFKAADTVADDTTGSAGNTANPGSDGGSSKASGG